MTQPQCCCLPHTNVNDMHLSLGILKCIIIWNHQEATTKIPKNTEYMCKIGPQQTKYDSATECLKQLHWLPMEQ